MTSKPALLGISYPAPPDRMSRTQHIRHMLDQGLDLGNDVVKELLDKVERLERDLRVATEIRLDLWETKPRKRAKIK